MDSTGAVTATNTFAGGVSSRRVGSASTFYTFDLQGGNSQRLDGSANLAGSSIFDSYGARASTDSRTDPYSGYGAANGYYTDAETGLSLCTFRFYDSSTGRFVNRAPSGYSGGLNLYGYADNNPVMAADPLGLSAVGGFGAGMAVGGGVFVLGTIATGGAILLPLLAAGAFVGLTSLWYQALGGDCETSQGLDMAGQVFNAAGTIDGGVDMAASAAEAGAQGADWAASAAGDGASDTPNPSVVRVGRWMSQDELDQMNATNKVQQSWKGQTYVTAPSTISGFANQAAPGSVYAEFDVPESSIGMTNVDQNWGYIVGPNSLANRLAIRQGQPGVTEMPDALNITKVATK